MSITEQIAALEAERNELMAEYDQKLEALKKGALQELVAARSRVEAIEKALGITHQAAPQPKPVKQRTEIDETDAGNGIGDADSRDNTAGSFRDELAAIRERTLAKRRRA